MTLNALVDEYVTKLEEIEQSRPLNTPLCAWCYVQVYKTHLKTSVIYGDLLERLDDALEETREKNLTEEYLARFFLQHALVNILGRMLRSIDEEVANDLEVLSFGTVKDFLAHRHQLILEYLSKLLDENLITTMEMSLVHAGKRDASQMTIGSNKKLRDLIEATHQAALDVQNGHFLRVSAYSALVEILYASHEGPVSFLLKAAGCRGNHE